MPLPGDRDRDPLLEPAERVERARRQALRARRLCDRERRDYLGMGEVAARCSLPLRGVAEWLEKALAKEGRRAA